MVSSFSHPPCRSKGRPWRISSQRPRIERGIPKANQNRLRSQCGENSFLQTKLNLKLPKSWYFDPKKIKVFGLLAMCFWVNPWSDAIHFLPCPTSKSKERERKHKEESPVGREAGGLDQIHQEFSSLGFWEGHPKFNPAGTGIGFNC